MKNRRNGYAGIGISSLFMVFSVLSLTAFGLLSFSSARSDWGLTQKHMQSLQSYYAADAKAQRVLCGIDTQLARLQQEDPSLSGAQMAQRLQGNKIEEIPLTFAAGSSGTILSFSVPSGKVQKIEVQVKPQTGTERYQIISYHLAASEEWDGADQPLEVWQGSQPS